MFTELEHHYMQHALTLAERGRYSTDPNPRVGCVLVKNGVIVGTGYHERAGEPHAEIFALRQAGAQAAGATAYVTLEPCAHHGRTPPCCIALAQAGVARVVCAMIDPDPRVAGQGLAYLESQGIPTAHGLDFSAAQALNPGFIARLTRGRPFLRSKVAISLDGRTALANGTSQWITGEQARADAQRLRAQSSAILTGIGTVLQDDPRLTVRWETFAADTAHCLSTRQPLRVILDSQGRLPPHAKLLTQPGRTLHVTTQSQSRADVEPCLLDTHHPQGLTHLCQELARRGCNEVLVEAGPTLNGALWQAGLIDELIVYLAPTLLGPHARPMFHLPELASLPTPHTFTVRNIHQLGEDVCLTLVPVT